MAAFQAQYDDLKKQAKQNRVAFNTAMNNTQRDMDAGRLTIQGAAELRQAAQREYDAKKQELRQAYKSLVDAERQTLLRKLQTPPAGTLQSDWRGIAQEVDRAMFDPNGSLDRLIDRAQAFTDAGLARGIAARSYQRFLNTGDDITHLAKLTEVDAQGVAPVFEFESAHGAFRPAEMRLFGPFGGVD